MFKQPRLQLFILLPGFLFCIPPAFAQTSANAYTLVPQTVTSGQSFRLALKNPEFSCATIFSDTSVDHNGNVFDLGFKAVEDSTRHCGKSDTLFGPVFSIPALNAGFDSVFAIQQPVCAPICALPVVREFAGVLTVVNQRQDSAWFIEPTQTPPDKPFTLQLLSYAYGNCNTVFTHDTLIQSGGGLYASFVIENHPERECFADIRPYGPSYDVAGLPVGKYPVYAVQHVACEYTPPYCPVAYPVPVLVDTLRVTTTSPVFRSSRKNFRLGKSPGRPGVIQGYWINGRIYWDAGR